MFNILTLNKISPAGLSEFDKDKFFYSDDAENPDAAVVRSASLKEMDFPDNFLAVARAGAGVNNIPVDKCTENGICVFNTPGANANAVKELVICALLMTSRKIFQGIEWSKSLKGSGDAVPGLIEKGKSNFSGPELFGKTLGIIGLGAIGMKVAAAAVSLGMKVIACDPYIKASSVCEIEKNNIKIISEYDRIFSESDYITLHTPLTDATRELVNKESLAKARSGIRIINFSRAEIVNSKDIIEAVKSGKCAAYATDFPNEALLETPGVIPFPHLGASTPEAEDNCAIMAVRQLSDYLLSGNVKNSVNFPEVRLETKAKTRIAAVTRGDKAKEVEDILNKFNIVFCGKASGIKNGVGYALFDTDCEITDECILEMKTADCIVSLRLMGN